MPGLLLVSSIALASSGRQIADGLDQLTGTELRPGEISGLPELSDPAPPFITADGKVEIYGSADYFIRYENWAAFEAAGDYEVVPLDLRYANGVRTRGDDVTPWDLRKFQIDTDASPKMLLVGGDMTPTHGRPTAVWPDDNINRRIFLYHPFAEPESPGVSPGVEWIRDAAPIVGKVEMDWLGHSYGGNFFQWGMPAANELQFATPTYFFYERVSDKGTSDPDDPGVPRVTQLFMRPIQALGDQAQTGPEVPILTVGNPPYPSTARTIGGYLMEGPRPFEISLEGERFIVVGFSCGDFPTDSYTMNYAWSHEVAGPYFPALNDQGTDLLDLGRELKERFGLSMMGRPAFYRAPDGSIEMLFHAATKAILPDNDYSVWPTKYPLSAFFRSIFRAKLQITLDPATRGPRIQLEVLRRKHIN